MADLIAIGYPDETTAEAAADEARRLARDLIIQPDAIAVIVRDKDGSYHVHTNHHAVGAGATWGMFWGLLFGLLFFIPVFGMAVGVGLGALMGKLAKTSIDKQFQDQVRDMLKPGTSALFLMVEKVTPDKAVEAMSKYGGTVLKTSLSKDDEKELQDALHGGETTVQSASARIAADPHPEAHPNSREHRSGRGGPDSRGRRHPCGRLISLRSGGRSSCDASPSASWKVSRKADTPTHMSSSAASVVIIPIWITATSRLSFSGSAGRTCSRTASRHTGSTSGVSTGSSRFPRQPRRADQNDPRTPRQLFRDRPELAVSCEGRSLLPADRGGFGPVHGRAGDRAARGAPICLRICLPSGRGAGPDRLERRRDTC